MDNQDIDTDINSYSLNELKEVFNITSDTYTIKVLNDKYNIKLQLNNSFYLKVVPLNSKAFLLTSFYLLSMNCFPSLNQI